LALLGEELRRFREERGFTLEDLAARAGLSISYLSEIERGRKNPSLKALDQVCRALNLPAGALVTPSAREEGISLGQKLRLLREERGLTLKSLGHASGLSPTYLSEIERGKVRPASGALRNVARALGVPVTFLLDHGDNRLGAKVKTLRENLGLTQAALAQKAGISAALVGQIENGRVRPSLKTIEKMASALGISPCYLIVDPNLEDMLAAMGPELRELLQDPQVQAVLRQICNLNRKELRFVLNFIEIFKQGGFR